MNLRGSSQGWAQELRYLLRRGTGAEAQYPASQDGVRRVDAQTVDLEKGEHRHQGGALVTVNEKLALGDAMSKDGRLEGKIGVLVMRVGGRPSKRALQTIEVAQVVGCLRGRGADDQPVQPSTSSLVR